MDWVDIHITISVTHTNLRGPPFEKQGSNKEEPTRGGDQWTLTKLGAVTEPQ